MDKWGHFYPADNLMNISQLIMGLFPGGGLLQLFGKAMGTPDADFSKPVNIFDPTPYKEQVWKRAHPGEEYNPDNVNDAGDTIEKPVDDNKEENSNPTTDTSEVVPLDVIKLPDGVPVKCQDQSTSQLPRITLLQRVFAFLRRLVGLEH